MPLKKTAPAPAPKQASHPAPAPSMPAGHVTQSPPLQKSIPMNGGRVPSPHVLVQSLQQAHTQAAQQAQPKTPAPAPQRHVDQPTPTSKETGILAQKGPTTQTYGQKSQYDVFSHGVSPAHEIAVPVGTPLRTPPGEWKVVSAVSDANPNGYIGNNQGQGWGNNVRLQNTKTGEVIGYNHMNNVSVAPGSIISGGSEVGASGKSGNATGPHVAFTYKNAQGQVGDFAQSPYAQYLFGGVQQAANAVGGAVSGIGNALGGAANAVGNMVGQAGSAVGQFFGMPQATQAPPAPIQIQQQAPVAPVQSTFGQLPPPTATYTPFQAAQRAPQPPVMYSPNQGAA